MKRLLEVKKKIGTLSKHSENPFFKSQYLDLNDLLNAVEPLLWEKGLMLLQPIDKNKVCSSIVDVESGKIICFSEIDLPPITDPQKLGSCITYFRRYTLKSLLAISEQDDDGNKASEPIRKRPLTQEGFEYLVNEGTKADIKICLEDRSVTIEQKQTLEKLLNK